ncbi:hypothetical protein [Bradyrhizobium diazoefficiens]|uniref:hypothetical protein n=1 Tax=Bradyrhizobium diazoefficiens TaxID=1355477 RepID=UPI0004AF93E9|nr:hypothetical protein [Bradyrhizobium diazoefficiens]
MAGIAKVLLLGIAAAALCRSTAVAQDAGKPNNYAAFVTALSALAASSQDAIQNERNAARLEFVRQQVANKILAAFPADPSAPPVTDPKNTLSIAGVVDETSLLCGFRSDRKEVVKSISGRDGMASVTVDHLNTLAQQNYLTAVAGKLQALAAPSKADDIFSAFKSLFATYQITVSAQPVVSDNDRAKIRKSCEADLKEYDAAFFGAKIPELPSKDARTASAVIGPEQLSLFGPVGAFAGTIMGIIQPVLVDFANLAADFEKKKAIKAFLSDASNQGNLRDSGLGLGRTGSDFLFAKRLSLAGTFAEQVAIVTGDSLDLGSKSVQAACPMPYDAMYRRGPDGLPSAQFRRCYRAVWGHFEDGIAAALKTAAAYDQLADAGDTSTQLYGYKALTTDFSKVADESGQVDFWDTVSKMLTFAGAVETAVSQDSLKKLQQSLDAVSKGK